MRKMLRRFTELNENLSRSLLESQRLPTDKTLWRSFEADVQGMIASQPDGAVIVDVGGGRRCVYHQALRREITLIATDVSADELALNSHADRTVVADVAAGLPLPSDGADLVVSRAVLEHVRDVRAAAQHMFRITKPGGRTAHLLPCRNSLFATAARLLPFGPLLSLLHWIAPETAGQVEFEVYYDQGTPALMRRAFEDAGWRDVKIDVTWASPDYFAPFFPAFLLYTLYEILVRGLRIGGLASYMVVSGRKPEI